MQRESVFFRELGSGPAVVCLHANASSSSQWRALMDRLAPNFRVLAADAYGAGKSPAWPGDRSLTLRDEATLVEPVFEAAGDSFFLVGHSYGGAVALIAALKRPERVRALIIYEPTMFSLIDADSPAPNDADGIRNAVVDSLALLQAGDLDGAARNFIDYWMGAGAFDLMPDRNRSMIAESIRNIDGWSNALLGEPTPLAEFARLDMPVLFMQGKQTTESARGVAKLLTAVLPNVRTVEFEGLGHMGPVTHPDVVNDEILGFLKGRVSRQPSLTS